MASKKTLNAENLEALGSTRLAALLMDISQENAEIKRRLRFVLAGATGTGELAHEIRKRLTTIGRSESYLEGDRRKAFIAELKFQHRSIVDQVAQTNPVEALDLLWRFVALANPVLDRCDDHSETIIGIFHTACDDLGKVAVAAKADPIELAERAYGALI